ncbi:trimethylamine methyltransferase family protein [Aestuariispira insulae]|uniref:Methyltransferase n=1 Tax=Aestuariispira insulae TaxID=1461337 RepID=A0A3D9HMT7_9PROT|nr:trimethylamine methyltransferase family protein [Aestuariispira insulae]RED50778.1 trimethylamine--corrinoid protein Co-methyltransferase [Aestuariispira insulae]
MTVAGNRRPRRRGNAREAVTGCGVKQLPWQNLEHTRPFIEVLSADELENIHLASLRVLEEIGVNFLLPEARRLLKEAGADVDEGSGRVRFDRSMVMDHLAKAPAEFTLHARNPERNLRIGGNHLNFCTVASAPNASDLTGGRRRGNQEDFRNFLKLGQYFNIIHLYGGYPVEPVDLPPSTRHLDCLSDFVKLSDKVFHAYSLGRERNLDGLEITRIARGISVEILQAEPSLFTIINANSPLTMDEPMLQGIIEMSSRNQVVVLTPFTLAGAMAPITLAGAVTQQNAEALAGIVFTQVVRAGAPVVYGGFTSNVDMKTGSPAFGTPEYVKAAQISGQLARRYQLPFRSSNVNASNCVDAQAASESQMALFGAIMGGTNFLMHGAGWLEGGLCASFEKFILDVDLLQQVAEYMKPVATDPDSLALDAMREVGPGGHYFGTAHTQERYSDAFYAPLVADWRNFETWCEAGAKDTAQRAHEIYRQVLEDYQAPPLDPAVEEELDAFVAKRKEEGGAPSNF